jgi:putative transcriptional regulator
MKIFTSFGRRPGVAKKSDGLEEINDIARPNEAVGGAKSLARFGCASTRRGLYFYMRKLGDDPSSRSFAGSLLVARPNMLDPNFRRTVLFISEHDPNEGALGVIINRPLDRQVVDLVSEIPPAGLAGVPVFLGGPVGKNQLMFAAFEWQKGERLKLNHNVALEQASDAAGEKLVTICAFVGYAGWGAGQLESELKQKAWLLQKANPSLVKLDRLSNLWFDIMRSLGPWYKMLAAAPDDPSLN